MNFDWLEAAPVDAVFGVDSAFKSDTHPKKVNLSVGAYRDDDGKPQVLKCVKMAGEQIYKNGEEKEYLPMGGRPEYCQCCRELLFGKESAAVKEGRVATVHTPSGTGALAALNAFMAMYFPPSTTVYLPDPTWPTHYMIFGKSFKTAKHPYWDAANRSLDIDGWVKAIRAAPRRSVFIVHPIAHNPTGMDPSHEQWEILLPEFAAREHFVLLDCAYQGFASSDLDKDAWAIRLFETKYPGNFAVSQSFAKNLGLYGERVGAAHIVCKTTQEAKVVEGWMKRICRMTWSNPPRHGGEIALKIFKSEELMQIWKDELKQLAGRINSMRTALRQGLEKRKTPGDWSHITTQIGMFSYLGISPNQVKHMTEKWHVYLMSSGRISVAGVNTHNVDYICDAIHDAVTTVSN